MDTSFYTAARGVRTQQSRIDVVSNNISNLNTTGYKVHSSAFMDLMYYNMRSPADELSTLKAGTGAMHQRTDIDFSAAAATPTYQPLDYAIMEDGFFMLEDPYDGEITYTRNGHFQASLRNDGNCYLITDAGKLVLDANGNRILVDTDAKVASVNPGVYRFVNTNGMLAVGDNEFTPVAKNGGPILVTEPDLRNGHLEMSNADVAEEYAKMIEGSRAYSYALKMVRTADEVEQTINSLRA